MAEELYRALTILAERGVTRGAARVLENARRNSGSRTDAHDSLSWRRRPAWVTAAAFAATLIVFGGSLAFGIALRDETLDAGSFFNAVEEAATTPTGAEWLIVLLVAVSIAAVAFMVASRRVKIEKETDMTATLEKAHTEPQNSPERRGRWLLVTIVALTVGLAVVWWFGLRDGSSPPEPVSFTFTDDCTPTFERPQSPAFSNEGSQATFLACEILETSDPRFSGSEIVSYSTFARDHGIVEISNEAGSWVGTWVYSIVAEPDRVGFAEQSALGSGDYEGLQATWAGPSCIHNCEWSGTIEPVPGS